MRASCRSLVLLGHRWAGLLMGTVLSIVGATGAVLAWPDTTPLHRIAAPLHDALGFGRTGTLIVDVATLGAVLLTVGGLWLWWKRRIITVRTNDVRRATIDLHHALGIVGLGMMLVLAITGLGMALTVGSQSELRRIIVDLHTARTYPLGVKLLYALGSLAFVAQSVSGFLMWWHGRTVRESHSSGQR